MIKLIWRTDVHLADKTPSRRTGNWTEDVVNKLKWIGQLASNIEADAVLDGGDFFDVKSPSRNSHFLVQQAFQAHKDYPCPVYGLVGNHDVKYGKYEYLPEQPLGVLFTAGLFTEVGDDKEIVIEKDGLKVRIVGIPYHGTTYDLDRLSDIERGDEDCLIALCHLLARKGKTGTMFEGEDIVGYDFLDTIPQVDCWCFGHWHKDQGVAELPNGSLVVNTGSLTRGSLHLDDLDRKPCVVQLTVDSDGLSYERHDVPVRDAKDAFKVAQALYEREDDARMLEIAERMKQMSLSDSEEPLSERVRKSGLSSEVIERALAYLGA